MQHRLQITHMYCFIHRWKISTRTAVSVQYHQATPQVPYWLVSGLHNSLMTVFINTSLEHTVHLSFAIITMKGYINRKAILEYSDLIWVTAFSKGSCLLFQRKKTIKLSTARCGGFTCSFTHGPWYCVWTGSAASIYTTVNCLDSITLFSSVEL